MAGKSKNKLIPEDIKKLIEHIDIMLESYNSEEYNFAYKCFKCADIDLRIKSLHHRFEEIKLNFLKKYKLIYYDQIIEFEPVDDTLKKLNLYKTLVNDLQCKDAKNGIIWRTP